MKKLVFLISMIVTVACTKEATNNLSENQSVSFNLKVSSFDIQSSPFKGLSDDPFATFKHQFPIGSNVVFKDTIKNKTYEFQTTELTLETFTFNLPLGTYKFSSHGGGTNGECNSVMSYNTPDQTVTITSSTTSIPITLHPTCAVVLIADPGLLIDETKQPQILAITDLNGNPMTPKTFNFSMVSHQMSQPFVRFLYVLPNSKSVLTINKKDNTSLKVTGTDVFKLGYIYKILVNPSLSSVVIGDIEVLFKEAQTINDVDGNVYRVDSLGDQVWMLENLKTTRYTNGDLIGTTTPSTLAIPEVDWGISELPKYQWAYNGDESNVNIYGRLYTGYAATDSRGVCPTGWHVPSLNEWAELFVFLGADLGGSDLTDGYRGDPIASGKLKETGTAHWLSSTSGATNETGFTGLPGGYRDMNGTFNSLRSQGYWWSTTVNSTPKDSYLLIMDLSEYMSRAVYEKRYGLSIRCLKN